MTNRQIKKMILTHGLAHRLVLIALSESAKDSKNEWAKNKLKECRKLRVKEVGKAYGSYRQR